MSYNAAYQNMPYPYQQLRSFCTKLVIMTLVFIMANMDVYLNSSKKSVCKNMQRLKKYFKKD